MTSTPSRTRPAAMTDIAPRSSQLERLRVCFIAGTLGLGGAERQLYYVLQALRNCGAEPFVLCLSRGEFWEPPIRELGVGVTCIDRREGRVATLRNILLTLRRAVPAVVQSAHFYTNFYAGLAGRLLRIPNIGAIRNDVVNEVRDTGRVLGCLSLRVPSFLAGNSSAGLDVAARMGISPARLIYLPNVIDADRFAPRAIEREAVRVLAVGRLVQQKRFDRLLHAVAETARRCKSRFEVVVAGDGPEKSSLETMARRLGVSGDVRFTGNSADLVPAYQSADVLVSTSDYEGTPNVILEAMSCGLPVVATGVGGVPDIVSHGQTGFLVEPLDAPGLVRALCTLIENRELRRAMGRSARRFIETTRALERLPGYLAHLYSRTISAGAA
jgi:glycosyltransferase involved in cell wall biosynthesis